MTNDTLSDLWNSTPNRPAGEAGATLAFEFVTRLRQRRRLQAWWLTWTFIALTGATSLVVVQLVKQGSAGVVAQGALWPMLALPWFAAFIFLRRFRQEQTIPGSLLPPLPVALAAARVSNQAERRRLVGVGTLLLVMAPVAAWAIWQLRVAGKATSSQAWSMALVFGAALALGGGFATWRYRRHVIPERSRIDALLHAVHSIDPH